MKYTYFAVAALAAALFAQTRPGITADQLRATTASTGFRVLAVDAQGRFSTLTVGPGIEITGGTIQVVAPPRAPAVMIRNADGTYAYVGGAVYRNGLLQAPGVDYTVAGVVLTPAVPWAADDLVLRL